MSRNWTLVAVALVIAVVVALSIGYFNKGVEQQPMVAVTVPTLSAQAKAGEQLYNQSCAACHGRNGAGSGNGPPLVHIIYEPSHHSDRSFQRAARAGVPAHHWKFGNMPPVAGISPEQVTTIISYVRELQRANGIQ